MNTIAKRSPSCGFTLIEILIVIGIIAILAAIVLVAVNPAEQFKDANDAQRSSNVNAIINAVGQYTVDQKGALPAGIPSGAANAKLIADSGTDICLLLVPRFLPALPADPKKADQSITEDECGTGDTYDTGYKIYADGDRVTVLAPETEIGPDISVTR